MVEKATMNDLTEQEEPFFSFFLDVFLPVTLLSDHSNLFEYTLLPIAPPLKTAFRLDASASSHTLCCNGQLISGYMTFFFSSARTVSQPLSNAALCQVACLFWRKYSWEQQGRTGTEFLTPQCVKQKNWQACFLGTVLGWILSSSTEPACPCCKGCWFAFCLSKLLLFLCM